MAKAKPKAKPKPAKRQPAKKRLPSSSVRKKPVSSAKTKVSSKAKRTVTRTKSSKKKASSKKIIKAKTVKRSSAAAKRKPVSKNRFVISKKKVLSLLRRNRRKTKNSSKKIDIKLGSIQLTLVLKITKTPVKKPKKRAKNKKTDLSFEKNIAISLIMIVIGLFGIIHSTSILTNSASENGGTVSALSSENIGSIPPQKRFMPRSIPTRIRIKAVHIDIPLITSSQHSDGTLEVPDNLKVAGWYKHSPTPGEMGPSIIAGHVNDVHGLGVFGRLYLVKKDQIILINRSDGSVAKFKVNTVKQFPQNSFPTQLVYGDIDYAGLRLITCGGNFNYLSRHYNDNTVVFASLTN